MLPYVLQLAVVVVKVGVLRRKHSGASTSVVLRGCRTAPMIVAHERSKTGEGTSRNFWEVCPRLLGAPRSFACVVFGGVWVVGEDVVVVVDGLPY